MHHAKGIVVDDHMLVGSCNYTTSSQCNREVGVAAQLNRGGRRMVEELYDRDRQAGEALPGT